MTRAKDISKIVTDANLSGTLDVTGAVTAGGLTVEKSAAVGATFNRLTSSGHTIDVQVVGNTVGSLGSDVGGQGMFNIDAVTAGVSSGKILLTTNDVRRQLIDNNGDISFYEDTGTTPKLFWDASAETLDVDGPVLVGGSLAADQTNRLALENVSNLSSIISYGATAGTGALRIITGGGGGSGGTEAMRIDSSGNVGIGTSSPDSRLDVATGANGVIFRYDTASTFLQILPEDANGDISLRYRANSGSAPDLLFKNDGGTERMRITEGGNVILSSTEPTLFLKDSNNANTTRYIKNSSEIFTIGRINDDLSASSVEHLRIDDSGNLLVGTTTNGTTADGTVIRASGEVLMTRNNAQPLLLNRRTSTGNIIEFRFDNSIFMSIGNRDATTGFITFRTGQAADNCGLTASTAADGAITPANGNGDPIDNTLDFGTGATRWDDIFASNGTIQTSDQNEKNTITDSDLGIDFIKRLTPKSYIFNGKTRTHYGLIAQDVETVLTDISKPTSGFAGFIKTDISEEQDGSEYRYGLRYTEFVAPLIQAVKDQQAIIEDLQARIVALENAE